MVKSRKPVLCRAPFPFLLLLLVSLFLAHPLRAQTSDPGPLDTPPDEGTDVDPSLLPLDSTLGDPVELYIGDPALLGSGGEEDQLDVIPGDGGVETEGTNPDGTLPAVPAPRNCSTYTLGVSPIGIAGGTHHYFNWNGTKVLVGVSADTGCHLYLADQGVCRSGAIDQPGNPAPDPSKSNYQQVLDDAKIAGINKIRLWVVLTGEWHPANVPFLYDTAGSYWHLDQQNPDFFTRLVKVVNYAKARNLAVEVTFFSPHQGGDFAHGSFTQGAWYRHTRGGTAQIGFTVSENFVIANDPRLPAAEQNMTQYQINVINWTVQALWCYENTYWEIANEPDSRGSGGKIGNPDSVAAWENAMITAVRYAETHALPAGTTKPKHLIAVQPFTLGDLTPFLPSTSASPVNIINGHYVAVNTPAYTVVPSGVGLGPMALSLGALKLLQSNYAKPMIFGFNETAITPYGGDRGTKSHVNFKTTGSSGELWGTVEPARAEVLEFLFGQGAAYDHLG
ncbi:MAG TPA: hypothetical protein VH988_14535, partial [Thermoanaerobaculia bacterium]|nr:hypothetical protein [Thermoanaerobaculia bacterium]